MILADVVATSAAIAATSKRTAKVAGLAVLFAVATADELPIVVGFLTGQPRQGRFGVGWATIAGLDVAADAGATAGAMDGVGVGDVASVVGDAAVTVAELDQALARLAATTGDGSQAARQGQLVALWRRLTVDERAFVFRLLTGELRQGANDGLVTDAVAKAAGVPVDALRRAAMFLGDLGEAAALARTGGAEALDGVGLQVLTAIQPMLAATSPDVATALVDCGGMASVEWKLDGARIQVHRCGDDVRVYTRNLNEIGERLSAVTAAVRALRCERVVLDGEALGLDADGRPQLFQHTMSRFGSDAAPSADDGSAGGEPMVPGATLQPYFFDILHLDGVDLFDHTLAERRQHLDALVGPWLVPAIVTDDPARATAFADEALANGHEGVMVKAITSRYEAGRRGSAWRKVKPVRTLDLVVLAAEWGHGRRTGWLSNLHLGARGADGGFVMVGKTFKGLTDALLTWQTTRLQSIATNSDAHVVHVRPELVVEIALDGVQVSRRYPGGVALRFARVRAYRPDKDVADADAIETVQAMLQTRTPPPPTPPTA